jgi:hypothetical protein
MLTGNISVNSLKSKDEDEDGGGGGGGEERGGVKRV